VALSGSQSVSNATTTTYTLTITGADGTATATATVTVTCISWAAMNCQIECSCSKAVQSLPSTPRVRRHGSHPGRLHIRPERVAVVAHKELTFAQGLKVVLLGPIVIRDGVNSHLG